MRLLVETASLIALTFSSIVALKKKTAKSALPLTIDSWIQFHPTITINKRATLI